MNNNNYIKELLDFQDENILINNISEFNGLIQISICMAKKIFSCPYCSSINVYNHGYYNRSLMYMNIGDKHSVINFKQRRLICKNCRKTFNEPFSLADKSSRISLKLQEQIKESFKKKQSFKDISSNFDISSTETINIFKENIYDYRCDLSRVLCIDEFKASTNMGKYALIIGDPISGNILDILPSRTQDTILYYFQKIPESKRNQVEYIVTDLFEPYRTMIRALFPRSIHIADRFHWIKLTSEAFNKIRIKRMNYYLSLAKTTIDKESKSNYNHFANELKKHYKLLLSNRTAHDEWYYDQFISKENNLTLEGKIEELINQDDILEEAYHLSQELYRIAKYSNEDNCKQNILEWCTKVIHSEFTIPELETTALTYRRWIKEISNSFIIDKQTYRRFTNGFIEGKNNFCKVIKRIGFGYNDFDILRSKIIQSNQK